MGKKDDDLFDQEDFLIAQASSLEKGAASFGKIGLSAFLKRFGIYIILAVFFFSIIFMGILVLFMPALSLKAAAKKIFGEKNPDSSVSANEIDEHSQEYQAWWYDPDHLLENLDDAFLAVAKNRTGYFYLTKDNFKDILEYVSKYQHLIRHSNNAYTYYFHKFSKDVSMANVEVTDEESVTALGARIEEKTCFDEPVEGSEFTGEDGKNYRIVNRTTITDVEDDTQVAHVENYSIENDPLFKVSWEEIMTLSSMKSVVKDTKEDSWEVEAKKQGVSDPKIDAKKQLDKETIKQIINSFAYTVGYYFDPTSPEVMEGGTDTYDTHTYLYDEMDRYAYVETKNGENTEHGTEDINTQPFEYSHHRKPAIAPAEAFNCYCNVEYIYTDNGDGTATCTSRLIEIDGQKFYDYGVSLMGEDFSLEWFVDFIKLLPGSEYEDTDLLHTGQGDELEGYPRSLADRFNLVLQSYNQGYPVVWEETKGFRGLGTILGKDLDRSKITHSAIRYETEDQSGEGGSSGSGNTDPCVVTIDVPSMTLSRQEFIEAVAKFAIEAYPIYHILPSFVVAQACLESRWGESGLATTCFNFFGMKWKEGCGTDYKSYLTKEQRPDGSYYQVEARFRKYANFNEGMQGYYNFITGYERYHNLQGVTDYKEVCRLIREDGWATSLNYTKNLISTINAHDFTKYDQIALSGGHL